VDETSQSKQLRMAPHSKQPMVVCVEQFSSLRGPSAAEIFRPLLLHLELANQLEKRSISILALMLGLLFPDAGELLTKTLQ
jgi:hypothetical protein